MISVADWRGRFRRPVFRWALAALISEIIAQRVIERESSWPRAAMRAIAVAPVIPAAMFMVALVQMVNHMDEMQRRICFESVFIAFVSTLVLTFVLALLEQAGVYRPDWSTIGTFMMAAWAVSYIGVSWKYR